MLSPFQSRAWGFMHRALTKQTDDFRPMSHQAQGAARGMELFERHGGFGLAHMMGLGKTITSMGLMELLSIQLGRPATVLVVCPKTVIGAWSADNRHYGADILVLNKSGAKNSQLLTTKLLERSATNDVRPLVVVTNYDMAWRSPIADTLLAANFDLVICDESQKIKNRTAKSSKFLHKLGRQVAYRVIASGTPALESGLDWFSQMLFCDPTLFGDRWYNFTGRFGRQMQVTRDRAKTVFNDRDPEVLAEFERLLFSRLHLVKSEEVLDLPELGDPKPLEFDLSPKERKAYDEMLRDSITELEDEFGETGEIVAQFVMTKALRLQQIAGGNAAIEGQDGVVLIDPSGPSRIRAAMEMIELIIENGEKVIVFHRFTAEGDQLRAALTKAKIGHVSINGSVKEDDRQQAVIDFQTSDDVKVFVGQFDASAEGITLTAGLHAIYYSTSYSGTKFSQSRHRHHRKGQTRRVHQWYMQARDTQDAERLEILLGKLNASEQINSGGWKRFLRGY